VTYKYYEKLHLKLIPFFLTQLILGLGVISPFIYENKLARWIITFTIFVFVFFEIFIILNKRPILIITDKDIILRGLKPGVIKLIQFWHQESIPINDIIFIKVGKIREDIGFGVKVHPIDVPSSSVRKLKFLWVRYRKAQKEMELYYPHTPTIKNFEEALVRLQHLVGNKVIVFKE
jgi:hypothetical protein